MSDESVFTLLDKLIEQTGFGNVKWMPTENRGEWNFRGTEASVMLTSVDKDNQLPVVLSIYNKDGRRTSSWLVDFHSAPGEEEFDERVRQLFIAIRTAHDPVSSLIRDLENMPPF